MMWRMFHLLEECNKFEMFPISCRWESNEGHLNFNWQGRAATRKLFQLVIHVSILLNMCMWNTYWPPLTLMYELVGSTGVVVPTNVSFLGRLLIIIIFSEMGAAHFSQKKNLSLLPASAWFKMFLFFIFLICSTVHLSLFYSQSQLMISVKKNSKDRSRRLRCRLRSRMLYAIVNYLRHPQICLCVIEMT